MGIGLNEVGKIMWTVAESREKFLEAGDLGGAEADLLLVDLVLLPLTIGLLSGMLGVGVISGGMVDPESRLVEFIAELSRSRLSGVGGSVGVPSSIGVGDVNLQVNMI